MHYPDESIDKYITDLRLTVKTCEYGTMADEMIKDRIVVGVHSDIVRGRLLREKDLCLTKAIDICKAAESSTKQLEKLTDEKRLRFYKRELIKQATSSNSSERAGLVTSRYGRTLKPNRRYTKSTK